MEIEQSREIVLELMCELTDDEVQMTAQMLGEAVIEQDKVQNDKSDAMKSYNDQLKGIAERLRTHSRAIRTRQEFRLVKCALRFHRPSPGFKSIVRLDTGELVREESMTDAEKQRHLFEPAGEIEIEQQELPIDESPEAQ